MSLIFIDGFDHYTDLNNKYQAVVNNTAGRASITTGGRYNQQCFKAIAISFENAYIWRSVPTVSSLIAGFAFKATSLGNQSYNIYGVMDSAGVQYDLRVNPDLTLSITRNSTALTSGTSTRSIFLNSWYFMEMKGTVSSSISANSCVLKVNNETWINVAAGQSTQGSSSSNITRFFVGRSNIDSKDIGSVTNYYDDLYICDTNGTINNDFLGDSRIVPIYPSGNATYTQFARNSGLVGNNYLSVSDAPPDGDNTYVETSGIGNNDTYLYTDLPSTAISIKGIQFDTYARKTDGGFRQLGQIVRIGSTDYIVSSGYITDNYLYYSNVAENNPSTGSSWTNSDINNLEAGIKLLS